MVLARFFVVSKWCQPGFFCIRMVSARFFCGIRLVSARFFCIRLVPAKCFWYQTGVSPVFVVSNWFQSVFSVFSPRAWRFLQGLSPTQNHRFFEHKSVCLQTHPREKGDLWGGQWSMCACVPDTMPCMRDILHKRTQCAAKNSRISALVGAHFLCRLCERWLFKSHAPKKASAARSPKTSRSNSMDRLRLHWM